MKKLILISGLVLFFLSCEAPKLKIGMILPQEGPASIYGNSALKGTNLAIEQLKDKEFFGKSLEFVIRDNRGLPDLTKEIMLSFGEDKDVICVIGPVISRNAFISASVSQKYSLPVLSPTATHPLVTKIGDFVFRVTFTDSIQGAILAKFVYEKLNKKKVAILYEANDPYSEVLSRNFEISLKNLGGEIVTSEFFLEQDTVFYSKLDKISSLNPEVLFLPVYANYVPLIIKQALEIKFTPVFVGGDGWYSEDLIENNKDVFKKVTAYISSPFTPDLPSNKVKDFVKKYKEKYGEVPDFASALAYDAVNIVYEVFKRMKEPERMELVNNLKGFEFEGVTGKISFKKGKDPLKDVFIIRVLPEGFKYFMTIHPE